MKVRPNNFDLIRLGAALQVAISHAAIHLEVAPVLESTWFKALAMLPGVPIFFVVSGFLISLSFERSASVGEYARNRCLRIFPALWVCLAASLVPLVMVAFPLTTGCTRPGVVGWWLAQMSLAQFYNPDCFRSYGTGVMNGSLWTITVELQYYLVVPLLYALWWRFRPRAVVALLAMVALAVASVGYQQAWAASPDNLIVKLFGVSLLPYAYMFGLGMLMRQLYERRPQLFVGRAGWWAIAFAIGTGITIQTGAPVGTNLPNPLLMTILAGLVIAVAFSGRAWSERSLRGNDVSYGVYIYHMPVVNLLAHTGVTQSLAAFAGALGATGALASASWWLVERRFLRHKHSGLTTSEPSPTP